MRLAAIAALAIFSAVAWGQSSTAEGYSLPTAIPWDPAPPSSVDQSVVHNRIYYLSDRSNAGVHVISLVNNSQITLVNGFVTTRVDGKISSEESGPNGLIVLPDRDELWVGDGDGTVKVISLLSHTVVANISTGSVKRADEFAYDPTRGVVAVTNPGEEPPFVSIIGAANRTVLGRVLFPNVTELEQPAWNPANGRFYVSVPSSDAFTGGSISIADVDSMSILATYGLPPCAPAGIVFGPPNQMFVGCSQDQITNFGYAASFVVDATDGSVVANISGIAGIDQVTYDPKANLYYASAYQMLAAGQPTPLLGIVDAGSNTLIETFATDNVTAHSVAVDSETGTVLVPVQSKGIQAFQLTKQDPSATAGTDSGTALSASLSTSGKPGPLTAGASINSSWSRLRTLALVFGVSLVLPVLQGV